MSVIAFQQEDFIFEYEQVSASSVWTIAHNLDGFPSVTVVDSAGLQVEGQVKYLSRDQVELTFSSSFAGTAYLS